MTEVNFHYPRVVNVHQHEMNHLRSDFGYPDVRRATIFRSKQTSESRPHQWPVSLVEIQSQQWGYYRRISEAGWWQLPYRILLPSAQIPPSLSRRSPRLVKRQTAGCLHYFLSFRAFPELSR
jgi:hypothetical protein